MGPPEATLQPPPPVLAEVVLVFVEVEVDESPLALGPVGTEGVVPLPEPPSWAPPAVGTVLPLSTPPSARATAGPWGGWVGGLPLPTPPSWVLSPIVPAVPPVPSLPPRVLPVGDWQVLLPTEVLVAVEVEVAVEVSGGSERTVPASATTDTGAPPGEGVATQVQSEGQSASLAQVLIFNWQVPGYEGDVVQTGSLAAPASTRAAGGRGGISDPDPPPVPEVDPPLAFPVPATPPPLATGADPEHVPRTAGWQTKPSPQSPSALHGRLHR